MFTTFFLQTKIVEELERIFEKERYPDRTGTMTGIQVFEQFLPVIDVKDTDDDLENLENGLLDDNFSDVPVPYIQVIIPSGRTSTINEKGTVDVLLYLCAYDDSKDRNGFKYIINMIQKVLERFQKDVLLDGYRCGHEIIWELSDFDDHPYYFGAMLMEFEIKEIEKEDKYC